MNPQDLAEELAYMLQSEAWKDCYKELEKRRQEYLLLLVSPSESRRAKYPDDFLRGAVAALTLAQRLPGRRAAALRQFAVANETASEYNDLDAIDSQRS